MNGDDPRLLGKVPRRADEDRGLATLIKLARKMPYAESPRRDASSYASFEDKLFARGRASPARGRRVRTVSLWAFTGLSTCAALIFVWPELGARLSLTELGARLSLTELGARLSLTGDTQLSYRVQPIALSANNVAAAEQELAFSDGSRVQLAEHSEAEVRDLTSHGARVVLDHGRAEVSIARRKQAAWQMVAGPYTVRVTGTAFRLAWSKERQELEVAMHHGSVVVTGPMAEQGVTLGKGQRLLGSPRDRRLLVEDWPRKQDSASGQVSALLAPAVKEQPPIAKAAREDVARAEHARGVSERGWAKRVAQGDFAAVLSDARGLGHARVLTSANVSDLGALADAARYARQDALGQRTLLALRERFPDSEHARDSAFLLGRLSRDQRALTWYERYLSEQPDGAYVSQALGRSMMLYYERDDSARATVLARSYLTRFPGGPYAASARKLSAASHEAKAPTERADHSAP